MDFQSDARTDLPTKRKNRLLPHHYCLKIIAFPGKSCAEDFFIKKSIKLVYVFIVYSIVEDTFKINYCDNP